LSLSAEGQKAEKTCPSALQPSNSQDCVIISTGNVFPPQFRLRKRSEFLSLTGSAQKCASRGILVVWQENAFAYARLGVTVSKKVGCAVTRNRIKRYIRETFRANRLSLPAVDLNVIARSEAAAMDFHTLQQQLLKAFRHIGESSCSKVSHS